jgi:hypothetical protein
MYFVLLNAAGERCMGRSVGSGFLEDPCACVYMYMCRYAWEWRDVVMMLRRNWMGWMDGRKE